MKRDGLWKEFWKNYKQVAQWPQWKRESLRGQIGLPMPEKTPYYLEVKLIKEPSGVPDVCCLRFKRRKDAKLVFKAFDELLEKIYRNGAHNAK